MVDNSSGGGGEVELNLAPIIDCFTVLITYLLVTASFISLTALDVGVNATNNSSEAPPVSPDKPPMSMTMDLTATGELLLKVTGGDLKQDYDVKVPAQGTAWDAQALTENLVRIHERWADLKEISVNAAPTTRYKDVVNVINEAQKTIPKVYLAGG